MTIPATPPPAAAAIAPTYRKSLLWLVAVGFFMQTLDATIINTALPAMAASLGESPLRMQSVVVAYALTMAMLIPASGWIADRFGTRRIFFCAIVLFAAGSVLCALSHGLGQLVAARFGLLEPAGPALPAETLSEAAVIVVPALAVDRRGGRLGRGAGFYDRSLPLRDPAAHLVAVVRDEELVEELPVESHDVRMTHAVTPGGGVVRLGHREWQGPDGGSST